MQTAGHRFESRAMFESRDAGGRTGVDTSSKVLMPNMTDKDVNTVFEKRAQQVASSDEVHPVAISDEKAEARNRAVESTARALSSGTLGPGTKEAELLASAIEDQLNEGGSQAADSLAGAITSKLPEGMKLEIKHDQAWENTVKAFYAIKREPAPEYNRSAQLLSQSGQVLGKLGISISPRQSTAKAS